MAVVRRIQSQGQSYPEVHLLRIRAIDHIALRSQDIERSLDFYCRVLGMEGVRVREWRAGEVPFPSIRVSEGSLIDLVPLTAGLDHPDGQPLDHFCLTLEPTDLDRIAAQLESEGMPITDRGRRFGARGWADSIYFMGPEGVKVELRVYPKEP